MTYLPNLIKRIDNFTRLANAYTLMRSIGAPTTWTMPDDPNEEEEEEDNNPVGSDGPGLYPKIISIAKEFRNQDMMDEITLIAELYKKALEINGGYNLVNRALSVALSNMDSLIDEGTTGEDELEAAEDILNEVSRDLRTRAKQSPSTQTNEEVATKALKEVKNNFNQQQVYEEVAAQPTVYEKGKPGAETGHGIGPRPAPETPQKYGLEIDRLQDSLDNDPNLSDPAAKASMIQLISVLQQLTKQITLVTSIRDALKITPDDPEKQNEFIQAAEKLGALRKERQNLKSKLNNLLQNKEITDIQHQISTTRNPAEKKWLEEKLKLAQLRNSKHLNKRVEIKHRQDLINALGLYDERGDFQAQNLSPDMLKKFQDAIAAGEALKISKEDYDRKQTLERAKQHGKLEMAVPKRPGRRGGGIEGEKLNNYKTELATYTGLVDKLGEKINTAVHVARLGVTQEKDKTHNALKPFVEAVSKAIQKKDNQAKYEAIRNLKAQMVEWANRAPAVRVLEKNVRLLPHFNKIKGELQGIAGWQSEGQWNITNDQRSYINNVISDIDRLTALYKKFYQGKTPAGKDKLELYYDKAIEHLGKVVYKLQEEIQLPKDQK